MVSRSAASFGVILCLSACSFDWDRLEPTGATSGGGLAGGGSSAEGGEGGAPSAGGSGGTGGELGGAGGVEIGPWSTPQPVITINSRLGHDDDPVFTADLRELYFNSDRGGGDDMMFARNVGGNSDIYETFR